MHLQQNHCHPTWQRASRFLNILSFSAQGLTTFSVNYTWLPGCCTTRSTAAPHVLWGVFESENRTLQAEHDLYLCGVTFYFSFQRRCSQVTYFYHSVSYSAKIDLQTIITTSYPCFTAVLMFGPVEYVEYNGWGAVCVLCTSTDVSKKLNFQPTAACVLCKNKQWIILM